MADAYIGEIRVFPFGFVPQGWLACAGQEYPVMQYQALYAIIGNTWGGTPNQTFKVPNLQTLCVMGQGQGPGLTPRYWGASTVGSKTVTLTGSQLPAHTHTMTIEVPVAAGSNVNTVGTPTANQSWLARPVQPVGATGSNSVLAYTKNNTAPNTTLHPNTIAPACGNATYGADPHDNRQPYLTMVFCINYDGVFPVRN
jgi:microcystin-dependent protein